MNPLTQVKIIGSPGRGVFRAGCRASSSRTTTQATSVPPMLQQSSAVRISDLFVYPVKSCRGQAVRSARLIRHGLEGDRLYIVAIPRCVRSQRQGSRDLSVMVQVTQRSHALMARIVPHLCGDGSLHLRWDHMEDSETAAGPEVVVPPITESSGPVSIVDVWGDSVACVDQGDAAAVFLAECLRLPAARLLRMSDAARLTDSGLAPGFEVNLADQYPLLLTSRESLKELDDDQAVDSRSPLPMERFRPNIVVTGGHAFEEDSWHLLSKSCGAQTLRLHCVQPCARCSVPDVDQQSGVRSGKRVMKLLQLLRNGRRCAEMLGRFERANCTSARTFREGRESTFFGVHQVASLSPRSDAGKLADLDAAEVLLSVGDELFSTGNNCASSE